MRLLVGFAGGIGHFLPVAPIARAAQRAGHTVAVAGRPAHASEVEALGFDAIPVGTDADAPATRTRLRRLDPRMEERVMREGFARRIAGERAAALVPIANEWRPDVVLCDETDFGAMVAAERLGIPHANVLVIAAGSLARRAVVAEPLRELRAAHDLTPDPELAMLDRDLSVSPIPPTFRDPAMPLPATALSIRPTSVDPSADPPPWLADLGRDRPFVYVTLGTVFNLESGDLFDRVLEAFRDMEVDALVTIGRGIDPAELGPVPSHVRIEAFVPQDALLPRCDLVLCHGGSGSVIGALAHGVPLVVVPMGADQPANAARCEALDVGRALDAIGATPADLVAAIEEVLGDPAYRAAAVAIRDETAALPGPERAVAAIERL